MTRVYDPCIKKNRLGLCLCDFNTVMMLACRVGIILG